MEAPNSDNFENKSWNIYYLAAIFIVSSIVQWVLLINFEWFTFSLNSWLLLGAYLTFLFIVIVSLVIDNAEKALPDSLQWIFSILIVEILVIISSHIVNDLSYILYYSLAAILPFMILMLAIGMKINEKHLQNLTINIYIINVWFIALILILMMVANLFMNYYTVVFCMITVIALPVLIANTLYISLLIKYNRYEIKSSTDCLKPAIYIYVLFGAYVWFTLSLVKLIKNITE